MRKWVARFKADGVEGLIDRSSRPHHLRAVTPEPVVRRIIALRRLRWIGKHIAREAGVSPATVSRVLHRAGLSRLRDPDPPEQVHRYEREAPGERSQETNDSMRVNSCWIDYTRIMVMLWTDKKSLDNAVKAKRKVYI